MDINPKVTILISVKNGEFVLDVCLESIFNQTYKNLAVLCIDDFSNDGTLSVMEKWKNKFGPEKFQIIHNDNNIGLTRSLNKGIALIDSPFIARIDADDWWKSDKLSEQMLFLTNNPDYGIVGCNYINVANGKEKEIIKNEQDEDIKKNIIKTNPFAHSCIVIKTDLIKSVGKYDESIKYGQDYDLWLRCMPHTKFFNIQKFLCYRNIEKGISIDKQNEQMIQGIKTQLKYIKKYNLSMKNYFYMLELFFLAITPKWIKKIKRKYIG